MSDDDHCGSDPLDLPAYKPIPLDVLLAPQTWVGEMPWTPGYDLELRACGGAYLRDESRYTIAKESYKTFVSGNRSAEVANSQKLVVDYNLSDSIDGEDRLKVEGDANIHAKERLIIGKGNINRLWEGGIVRLIGMEGVICGGLAEKFFFAGAVNLAPLVSGDVYGGGVHAAGIRMHMAGKMGYRSSERARWAAGVFIRSGTQTIEPIADSRQQNKMRGSWAKAGRIGLGLCPILDILWGVGTAPIFLTIAIIGLAKSWKKPPPPPKGPPRVHNRTVGVVNQTRASDKSM